MARRTPPPARSLAAFFLLLVVLSIPFWIAGALAPRELLPKLPLAALMAVCPLIAAALLVYRVEGRAGVASLVGRAFDARQVRPRRWLLPALLLMPGVAVLSYWILRATAVPVPELRIALPDAALLFVAFFLGAVGEEAGFSGYATDPMLARWTALGAGVLLGVAWAAWHVVPLLQVGRPAGWIAWWALGTVGHRVVMVWLYNNTGGSVFAVALYHASSNLSWQLFPDRGSHYDPRVTGLLVLGVAGVVALVWGPRTLSRAGSVRSVEISAR